MYICKTEMTESWVDGLFFKSYVLVGGDMTQMCVCVRVCVRAHTYATIMGELIMFESESCSGSEKEDLNSCVRVRVVMCVCI